MRFPRLALALTATAALSILGASPALASTTHDSQAALVSNGALDRSLSDVVADVCEPVSDDTVPSPCDDSVIDDGWDKA